MLKRFLDGLVLGAGFGIAFVAIWVVSFYLVWPLAFEASIEEPKFSDPKPAELAEPSSAPEPSKNASQRNFDFFKHSGSRMEIPKGGGILSMATISTPADSERPRTYQLWLTDSELWQIRTTGENAEIEELPYPEGASAASLSRLMRENLGMRALSSTMTISAMEIDAARSGKESWRDDTLNGKLAVTKEGAVFVLPNPY